MVHVWCSWVSSKVTMCNTSVLNIVVMYVMLHISYMPCSNAIYWKIDTAYSRQIDYTLFVAWSFEQHNTVTPQCSSSLQETPCTYTWLSSLLWIGLWDTTYMCCMELKFKPVYPLLHYFQEFLKLLVEPFILKVIKAVAQPGPHCMDDPRRITEVSKQWHTVCNTS